MKTNPLQFIKAVLLVLSFLIISTGYSQNKTILRAKPSADMGISTGKVIAYNKEVAPPYFIELKDNKILINNIQYYPKLKDPSISKKRIKVSEATRQKFNLSRQLDSCYLSNIMVMDEKTAAEDLIVKFNQRKFRYSSIAKALIYKKHSIIIHYIDGKSEAMELNSYHPSAQKNSNQSDPKRIEAEYNKIKKMLIKGWTVRFDYKKTDFIPSHK
jgi:hypothetical protein